MVTDFLRQEIADKKVVTAAPVAGVALDRSAHLVHPREKLFEGWSSGITNPIFGYLDTPVHDTL